MKSIIQDSKKGRDMEGIVGKNGLYQTTEQMQSWAKTAKRRGGRNV